MFKVHKIKILFFTIISFIGTLASGQNSYLIDAHVNLESQTLIVSQTLIFKNPSNKELRKIYLSDWANSYEGTESQLVKHLANQFNRSFYLSSKNKLGFTNIKQLSIDNKQLEWSRIKDHVFTIDNYTKLNFHLIATNFIIQ